MPPTDPSPPPSPGEAAAPAPAVPPDAATAAAGGPLDLGHPKGTLAIVILYALLFTLGWLALYWLVFVPRGTPHP